MRHFVGSGNEVEFLTSTVLVQAVHHASEHRASDFGYFGRNHYGCSEP